MLRHLPNCITVMRIIGTLSLFFTKPMTLWFYIVYTITGITDVLDGVLARKLKLTSEFGAKLDSIADLIYYATMGILLLPELLRRLPNSLWITFIIVVVIRLLAYITAAFKFRRFASTHTYLNKISGFCVFLIPFALIFSFGVTLCWIFCIINGLASLNELFIHLFSNSYAEKIGKKI